MKKLLIGIVVLAAVAGGLYYGLAVYPSHVLRVALDDAIRGLPPGYSASYKTATFSLFSRHANLTGVAIHRPEPDSFDASVETVEVVRPSTDFGAAWAHAAADPSKISPDLALVLGDSIAVRGVSYRDANSAATLASARADAPRVYPWALLHPDVPSMTEARAFLLARTHPPVPADFLPILRAEAVWALGFGYDGYIAELIDVAASVPATATTQAGTATYSVQKVASGKYDRGDGTGASLDGITMRSDMFGSIGIAHIAIEGMQSRGAFTKLLAGDALSPAMLDGFALKRLVYGPMSAQPSVGAPSVLGTLTVANIAFSHGVLVSGDLALDGFRINRDQVPNLDMADNFDKLGLDAMTLSIDVSYSWDIDQRRLAVRDATIQVNELGKLKLSFELGDLGAPQDFPLKTTLVHAMVRYEDASLVGRAFKIVGEMQGADPATLRDQIIAQAQQVGATPGAKPATVATARAISDFLTAPQSLTVEIAPAKPLSLFILLGVTALPPDEIVPQLGISIAANR